MTSFRSSPSAPRRFSSDGGGRRRSVEKRDLCMDDRLDQPGQIVLMDPFALKAAVAKATQGGKQDVEGLYLPSGKKLVSQSGDTSRAHAPSDVDTEDINLQRLAKIRKEQKRNSEKRAAKLGKSQQDIIDAESARKASAILEKSTENDKLAYDELFNFFDVNGDKKWGSIEFAQKMTNVGFTTSVEEASNLLYFAGVRDVDRITYDDFVQLMPKLKAFRMLIEKEAMEAFRVYDDGTGHVSVGNLKKVLHLLSPVEGLDPAQEAAILKKATRLKESRVSFEYFFRALADDMPPLGKYEPPRSKQSVVGFLVRSFGCGSASKTRGDDDHHGRL